MALQSRADLARPKFSPTGTHFIKMRPRPTKPNGWSQKSVHLDRARETRGDPSRRSGEHAAPRPKHWRVATPQGARGEERGCRGRVPVPSERGTFPPSCGLTSKAGVLFLVARLLSSRRLHALLRKRNLAWCEGTS